jgi:hypothetical protein
MGQRVVFLDQGENPATQRRGLFRGFLKRDDALLDAPPMDGLAAPPWRGP